MEKKKKSGSNVLGSSTICVLITSISTELTRFEAYSHAKTLNFYYLQLNSSSLPSQQDLNLGCRTKCWRDPSALLTTYHEQTPERMGKPHPCLPLLSVTASSLVSLLIWAILLAEKQEAHPIHLLLSQHGSTLQKSRHTSLEKPQFPQNLLANANVSPKWLLFLNLNVTFKKSHISNKLWEKYNS